jgi:hypothetical protein
MQIPGWPLSMGGMAIRLREISDVAKFGSKLHGK